MSVPETSFTDVGNSHPFVMLEHVNINTGPWSQAFTNFYFNALGFISDPRAETALANTRAAGGTTEGLVWANIGLQQLHLPSDAPQHVSGHIGLVYSNLENVANRLQLVGVSYKTVRNAEGQTVYIETECPVGNVFRLREQSPASYLTTDSTHTPPITSNNLPVGSYLGPAPYIAPTSDHALPGGLSAGLGMSYVELSVPPNTTAQIAAFYHHIFGCNPRVSVSEETCAPMCVVFVGCYTEVLPRPLNHTDHPDNPTNNTTPAYDGYHIAVYVNDFVAIYERLKTLNLVYENPRFPQFTYGSLEEVNNSIIVFLCMLTP